MPRVVAAETLKKGEAIDASQVRVETAGRFPILGDVAQTIDQVVGRAPMRVVVPGTEIHLAQLMLPPDVNRGEMVEVEVRSGAAHLASSGRRNPQAAAATPSSFATSPAIRCFRRASKGRAKPFWMPAAPLGTEMCSPHKILAWLLILCASEALVAADTKAKKPRCRVPRPVYPGRPGSPQFAARAALTGVPLVAGIAAGRIGERCARQPGG